VVYVYVFNDFMALSWQDYKSLTSVWTTACFSQMALNLLSGFAPPQLMQPVVRA
jgi:hypothetical protein